MAFGAVCRQVAGMASNRKCCREQKQLSKGIGVPTESPSKAIIQNCTRGGVRQFLAIAPAREAAENAALPYLTGRSLSAVLL